MEFAPARGTRCATPGAPPPRTPEPMNPHGPAAQSTPTVSHPAATLRIACRGRRRGPPPRRAAACTPPRGSRRPDPAAAVPWLRACACCASFLRWNEMTRPSETWAAEAASPNFIFCVCVCESPRAAGGAGERTSKRQYPQRVRVCGVSEPRRQNVAGPPCAGGAALASNRYTPPPNPCGSLRSLGSLCCCCAL